LDNEKKGQPIKYTEIPMVMVVHKKRCKNKDKTN